MPPQTGHFILHSNVTPPVTAGPYELVTSQTGLPFTVAEERSHITVSAPRFTMPPEQILSTFPPANGEGAFGDRLPQIVLKRRTLPWERNPAGVPGLANPLKPWLALVVVAEGEAQLSVATAVEQCVTAGTKLLDPDDKDVKQGLYLAVTETVVKKVFPCEEDLELLVHVREVDINDTELANGDDDGWLAVILSNRLPVFDTLTGNAVRYMACLVNIEGQLAALPKPQPFNEDFQYDGPVQDWTVLDEVEAGPDPRVMGGFNLGNVVLPSAEVVQVNAKRAAAAPIHAAQAAAQPSASPRAGVALDGAAAMKEPAAAKAWTSVTEKVAAAALDPDAKQVVRDTMRAGFRYPIELVATEKVYRFPLLAHWSFTSNDGATFETLMQDLDVGLLGTVPAPAPGAPPPARPAPEVVETGHIKLANRARRGDAVGAWYRGPLVPFPTLRDEPVDGVLKVAHAADQIRPVVPDGHEDLSLAAGFEIGRLLGLSQLSVVASLLRFRGEQFGIGRARELLDSVTSYDIPEINEQPIDLGRFVALRTLDEMAKRPADVLGPRRPVADPGREIVVDGDLDEVVANGLGLDLAALRARSNQVGVLAALGETKVPVAAGSVEMGPAAVAQLRGALGAEVAHVVGVAAPAPVLRPPVTRGRRAQARPATAPDALDELLERASSRAHDDPEDF